jgi:hypothetical protein
MKFMVTWDIPENNWLPVIKMFSSMSPAERANYGDGVKAVGRWHDPVGRKGVVVVESDSLAAVQRYMGKWNPHMELTVTPVVDDEEAATVYKQIVSDNGA